jgi:hypothetical protein
MAIGRHIAVLTLSDVAPVPGVQATAKVTRRGPAESRATLGLSGSPGGSPHQRTRQRCLQ